MHLCKYLTPKCTSSHRVCIIHSKKKYNYKKSYDLQLRIVAERKMQQMNSRDYKIKACHS